MDETQVTSGQQHQKEASPSPRTDRKLSLPWLTPVEKFFVYTVWLILALAIISLSFPSVWHQAALVFQALTLGWSLFIFVILGLRGYDEERIGNKKMGTELLGLAGLFFAYFGCVIAFGATTWPLWIQSAMFVLLLLMSLRARNMYR